MLQNKLHAAIGDLVFCLSCGDSNGWVINQLALVKEVTSYLDCGEPDLITSYRIWIFNLNKYETVTDKDFEIKNLILISRASGDNKDLERPGKGWDASIEKYVWAFEKQRDQEEAKNGPIRPWKAPFS